MHYDRTCTCLFVGSFVRSLVCLLLLLSAGEDMGLRIEQSRRSSLSTPSLVLSLE